MDHSIIGYSYTWWRGDPLPSQPSLTGFNAAPEQDFSLLADLVKVSKEEVARRFANHSQPYIARMQDIPVAYGWVASEEYEIGHLGLHKKLSPEDRFLWDFATLPRWRGQGIYPHLLQAILQNEPANARRFWIGHDASNTASGRGILKAGFQLISHLEVTPQGIFHIVVDAFPERARLYPLQDVILTPPTDPK